MGEKRGASWAILAWCYRWTNDSIIQFLHGPQKSHLAQGPHVNNDRKTGPKPSLRVINKLGPVGSGPRCTALDSKMTVRAMALAWTGREKNLCLNKQKGTKISHSKLLPDGKKERTKINFLITKSHTLSMCNTRFSMSKHSDSHIEITMVTPT